MSEMDIHRTLKRTSTKNYKSGRQMMLMEIVLVSVCLETQKVQ